jgi:exodeoxyribonuclease V alpha subunit
MTALPFRSHQKTESPASGAASKIAQSRAGATSPAKPQTYARIEPARAPATTKRMPGLGPAAGLQEVRGRIIRTLFSNAETGKVMFLLQDASGKTFKLQGVPAMLMEEGRTVVAWASVESHPKYGEQYTADFIDEEIPVDRRGAIAYMSRALEGVGEVLAGRIYDAFGKDTYDVISNSPERLREVEGIGEAVFKGIVDSWNERSVIRSLWTYLAQHEGIGPSVPMKIYARFGQRSMEAVRTRPYDLARLEGVGFKTADAIAMANGFPRNSSSRITGAVAHVLAQDGQQGHTSKPVRAMVTDVAKLTGLTDRGEDQVVRDVVMNLVSRGDLIMRELDEDDCVTPKTSAAAERAIARRILELSDAGGVDEGLAQVALKAAASLKDAEQAQAVANAFRSAISVITGRPGCGKTTVTKVLANVAQEAGLRVVMCAPTGKAARRTTEATGFASGTVHSLIGYRPDGRGGMTLEHDRLNPLEGDLFILDEASMMDTGTMNAFLNALPDGARLVLVGDSDQLPSVGAGNVLHDIIASGKVAVTQLQTPHRTALDSDIIVNAHRIINGDVAGLNLQGKKDFQFSSVIDEAETVKLAVAQYLGLVEKHGVENVQVLAARRGTECGVHALNEALRMVVNPPKPGQPFLEQFGQVLRLGDRVIRTSNNRELGVSNGEVGIITRLDAASKTVTVNFGDRDVVHNRKELRALELAYAITAHKSQGSEYAGVVLVAPRSHKFMFNRNLFYTAVTRGKKDVRIVGAPDTIKNAVSRPGNKRCTGLAMEIRAKFHDRADLHASAAPRKPVAPPPAVVSAIEAARRSAFRRRP